MINQEINKECLDSILKYYDILSYTGYMKYDNVFELVSYMFVEELINTGWNFFITDEDYIVIEQFLKHLNMKNCMIPWQEFKENILSEGTVLPPYKAWTSYRITEGSDVRSTETGNIRHAEYKTGLE